MSGDALASDQSADSTKDSKEEIGMESTLQDDLSSSSSTSKGISIPRTLTKKQYSSLSNDADKSLYQENDKGEYIFMAENAQELRRAKDRISVKEKEGRDLVKELKAKLDAINEQHEVEEFESAKAKGDIQKLEASYKSRLGIIENKYKKSLEEAQQEAAKHKNDHLRYRRDREIDRLANEIASELAISPFALMPHIKSRLEYRYNEDEGEDQIFVLDEFGNRTHDNPEGLKKTLREDQRLAALIKAVADPDGVDAAAYAVTSGALPTSYVDGKRSSGRPVLGSKKIDLTEFDSSDPTQRKAFAKYLEQKTAARLRKQGRR